MNALKKLLLSLFLTTLGFSAYSPMHASAFAGGQSANWAGYVATDSRYTAVNGSWTVPAVPASNSHLVSAEWIGIGGINSTDLIQIGTEAISDQNYSRYVAWYEVLPANPVTIPMVVHAGDSVSTSINLIGTNLWRLQLKNNTTGENYMTELSYASSLSSAEWIEERPKDVDHFLTLTNFGRVNFTSSTVVQDGMLISARDAAAGPLTMVEGTQFLARATSLGPDGQSFSVYQPENPNPQPLPVPQTVQAEVRAPAVTTLASPGVTMPSTVQGSYVIYYTQAGTPIRVYKAAANYAVAKPVVKKVLIQKIAKKVPTKKAVRK
ncbi:MAG: G1 family glutamic endopeptidase [Patescibacteria group bacterium]